MIKMLFSSTPIFSSVKRIWESIRLQLKGQNFEVLLLVIGIQASSSWSQIWDFPLEAPAQGEFVHRLHPELPVPPSFFFPSPATDAAPVTFFAKIPKILPFMLPLFGGILAFIFFWGLVSPVSIALNYGEHWNRSGRICDKAAERETGERKCLFSIKEKRKRRKTRESEEKTGETGVYNMTSWGHKPVQSEGFPQCEQASSGAWIQNQQMKILLVIWNSLSLSLKGTPRP